MNMKMLYFEGIDLVIITPIKSATFLSFCKRLFYFTNACL